LARIIVSSNARNLLGPPIGLGVFRDLTVACESAGHPVRGRPILAEVIALPELSPLLGDRDERGEHAALACSRSQPALIMANGLLLQMQQSYGKVFPWLQSSDAGPEGSPSPRPPDGNIAMGSGRF
jgi:hypothetical protein